MCPADVREVFAVVALRFHGAVEEYVDGAHADIVDHLRSLSEVGKPGKDQ